ncbi:MAG: GNAT family N-acetyltransferase [Patescibacteria group bacterium]|nr:GNAT family N-acetyltransferase [Patescibacteria group bacterium]MDE1945534.1 GNAT family N-acetyltransferase [Patescibacteria group bacterium]MDE2058096.1 GNAT family N-acetyltransferase [Patescibacteria group bacterium]
MDHHIAYPREPRRVALAQMREEYVPEFVPGIVKRIGVEGTLQRPPYSLNMGREWVKSLDGQKGVHEVFAILVKDDALDGGWRYVGHTGIHHITATPGGYGTAGIMIFPSDGKGRGNGSEAMLLLLYHCFFVLGLRKVKARVKAFNAPSLGHLLKCGYRIIGPEREEDWHEGRYVDSLLLEVLRREWEPIWDAYQASGELPRLSGEQRALVARETSA